MDSYKNYLKQKILMEEQERGPIPLEYDGKRYDFPKQMLPFGMPGQILGNEWISPYIYEIKDGYPWIIKNPKYIPKTVNDPWWKIVPEKKSPYPYNPNPKPPTPTKYIETPEGLYTKHPTQEKWTKQKVYKVPRQPKIKLPKPKVPGGTPGGILGGLGLYFVPKLLDKATDYFYPSYSPPTLGPERFKSIGDGGYIP